MKEKAVKTSFFEKEAAKVGPRRKITDEIAESIPKFRQRLEKVFQKKVLFPPDEVEGNKVELVPGFYSKSEWVDGSFVDKNNRPVYRELSRTILECETVLKRGKKVNILLSSDIYPPENQADTNSDSKPRHAVFQIYVKDWDFYFSLDREGAAIIYWLEGTEDKKRQIDHMNIDQIRALGEIIDMIESPRAKFVIGKYSLEGVYKKISRGGEGKK